MNQSTQEKVFAESFSEYGDAIFRFCIVKVSNVELAEDMTQEVFTRYWQYLRDGKEMTNTRALLYTIAHNLAKDWYKKKKSDSLDARMESGYEPSEKGIDAESLSQYEEILTTIRKLSPEDQEILMLRYVEGLDPKDIADILAEKPNAISVRLHRATQRLKKEMHI